MGPFQASTVLITGAGAGIGREMALQFAAHGARVVAVDCNEATNLETARLIEAAGGCCQPIVADVGLGADIDRIFQAAGEVDVLVNNAFFSQGDGLVLDVADEIWDRVQDVCLKAVFRCSRAALRGMVERRGGVIVNISSVNALSGIHLAAYSAAKGGVNSLTKVMAVQYARYGIRINAICPGTILSESSKNFYDEHPEITAELRTLYPGGKFGRPADIAALARFLASDQASFINGAILPVDGGVTAVHRIPSIVPFVED